MMNERIMKLFDQAIEEFKQEQKYATIIVPNPLKEKFAELIVRECISLCQESIDDGCVEAEEPMCKIQEHFGVAE